MGNWPTQSNYILSYNIELKFNPPPNIVLASCYSCMLKLSPSCPRARESPNKNKHDRSHKSSIFYATPCIATGTHIF